MVDTTGYEDDDEDRMKSQAKGPVATGSILGVHNLSVVFPQFIVALVSSVGVCSAWSVCFDERG